MAGHDLEAPGGDEPSDWDLLYRTRGAEEVPHRPVLTGDVFQGTTVRAPDRNELTLDVMVVQHPCALRSDGVHLNPGLLVAEVHDHPYIKCSKWTGFGKRMPLPGLKPSSADGKGHAAAFFDSMHIVSPVQLGKRVACLSQLGVNLLLQRWVHHNSRVVVPTATYDEQTSGVFEEADLIEDWCEDRLGVVTVDAATTEAVAWLRQPAVTGGEMRQKQLAEPQLRSQIRKDMRAHLKALRSEPAGDDSTAA